MFREHAPLFSGNFGWLSCLNSLSCALVSLLKAITCTSNLRSEREGPTECVPHWNAIKIPSPVPLPNSSDKNKKIQKRMFRISNAKGNMSVCVFSQEHGFESKWTWFYYLTPYCRIDHQLPLIIYRLEMVRMLYILQGDILPTTSEGKSSLCCRLLDHIISCIQYVWGLEVFSSNQITFSQQSKFLWLLWRWGTCVQMEAKLLTFIAR